MNGEGIIDAKAASTTHGELGRLPQDQFVLHKKLTRLLMSVRLGMDHTIDPQKSEHFLERKRLEREWRDFSPEEIQDHLAHPLSLEEIKEQSQEFIESGEIWVDTYSERRINEGQPLLMPLILNSPLTEALKEIENKALVSSSHADQLWGLGVPIRVAEGISSPEMARRVDVLDYYLRQGDITEDNTRIERIFPSSLVSLYVDRLINHGRTNGREFNNALAMVSYNDLGEKTKTWLRERGLVLVDHPIQIHLLHKDDKQVPCHEIGWHIFDSHYWGNEIDEYLALGDKLEPINYLAFYPSERFPQGSLAEIVYLTRWRLVVAGGYVASTHSQARGIFVPYMPDGTTYMSTENSFTSDPDRIHHFYIRQTGADDLAKFGFQKIYEKLQREKG